MRTTAQVYAMLGHESLWDAAQALKAVEERSAVKALIKP